LILTNHHIILDGWSWPLLIGELFTHYAGGVDAAGPVGSYRDFLAWLATRDHDTARTAWQHALAGVEPTLLAAPTTTDTGADTGVVEQSITIDRDHTRKL